MTLSLVVRLKRQGSASAALASSYPPNSDVSTLMQMHSNMVGSGMNPMYSPETVAAWVRLLRAQQGVLAAIQAELKLRGFPPLAWYEALLELSRAANGKLRPYDLEKAMLLPQYSTSPLLDRLVP